MRVAIAVLAFTLAGCASLVSQPYHVEVPAPDQATAFDCAAATMAERGYVPEVSNRETGTIRGVQQMDQFTTTMVVQFAGPADARVMRVNSSIVNRYGQGQTQHLGSTEYTRADADAVAACATD